MMYGSFSWWLVVPLIVCIVGIYYQAYYLYNLYSRLAASQHRAHLLKNFSVLRLSIKTILRSLVVVCVVYALCRPRIELTDQVQEQTEYGRDVVIALDISRSMLAADYPGNRLECAKKKITSLLSMLSCERVALVVFAGDALVQCPLTRDFDAFLLFLRSVDTQSFSAGTTSLARAISKSMSVFDNEPERRNKLVVMFTDGEDFSENLETITHDAASRGVAICTVGIGSAEGAPIPVYDHQGVMAGHQRDDKGAIVLSRLNEQSLRALAQTLQGLYVHADPLSARDMHTIKQWIEAVDKEAFGHESTHEYYELFVYYSAAAFAAAIGAWLL